MKNPARQRGGPGSVTGKPENYFFFFNRSRISVSS